LKTILTDTIEVPVRFSEVDSLGIVWHGHYLRYFEDGRESFGTRYGLSYLDYYAEGYLVPIVSVQCDYKQVVRYGDRILVETIYTSCESAKINFTYRLVNAETRELVVTGSTTQVFLSKDKLTLQLTNPDFFTNWKAAQGLIQ
jgi:acyl-CoA thioester hydrolase